MHNVKAGSIVVVATAFLSGCVSFGPGPISGPSVPRGPNFADGNWQQGAIASYVFGNGSFVGTANDTGNKVADGTYRYVNANTIQISSYSAVQQKTIVANCLLVGGGTAMNCTNDTGLNFTLTRNVSVS